MWSIVLHARRMFYYSIVIWMKKPSKELAESFSYHQHSQFKTMAIFLSILLVIEGVLFHFVVLLWSERAAWLFSAINIYGLVYMAALYNSAKYLPHLIKGNRIIIRSGYLNSIEVGMDNVAEIKSLFGRTILIRSVVFRCDSPEAMLLRQNQGIQHAVEGGCK